MAGRLEQDCSNRFLLHAVVLALFCAIPGAWAEDGVAVEIVPAPQAQDAPRQPDEAVIGQHIGQFENIWKEHDRKDGAENAAVNAALAEKHGAQKGMAEEPQLTLNEGEDIEAFKQRSLDFSAKWQTEHGRPTYRTEDGHASFQIDGLTVTKDEYLAHVERGKRQNVDRKKALDGFTEQTRFGIKSGEAGYDTDERIEQMKDDVKQLEQHDKAQIEQMKEQFKTYVLPKTLISKEGEKATEPR